MKRKYGGTGQALALIHEQGAELPVSEETILRLHRLTRGEIWDAGKYKEKDGDIIEEFPDGRSRARFKTVPAGDTPASMKELTEAYDHGIKERKIPPLMLLAAFNLDFLCIHPFRDGNGRVSRLLLLLQCYHLGFEVGRYISLERLIEQNKERYYETLEQSSHGWHEGKHDPWLYINFILFIIKTAYREFEDRLGRLGTPKGEKTALVLRAVDRAQGPFRIAELQNECPNVSVYMIRRVLKDLRAKTRWSAWAAAKMPNGARRVSGNWVIPNEIGNELGNIVGVIQKMENTRHSTYDLIGRQTRQTGLQRGQKWAKGTIGSPARPRGRIVSGIVQETFFSIILKVPWPKWA